MPSRRFIAAAIAVFTFQCSFAYADENAQPMTLECTKCTRLTGNYDFTFLNPTFNTTIDPYANLQCMDYFQCVDTIPSFYTYGQDTPTGCCEPCAPNQACFNGTIGSFIQYATINMCPDGHICRPEPEICPAGTICKHNIQLDCAEIRRRAIEVFKLGDIHAGMYCPEGSKDIGPCPAGSYCPDPATIIKCPAGYFCPMKSAEPLMKCDGCSAGTPRIMRTDWLIFIIAPVAAAFVGAMIYYKRKNRNTIKLEDAERLWQNRGDDLELEKNMNLKTLEEKERVQPILEKMATRVEELIEKQKDMYMAESPRKIFNHPHEWLVNELDPGKLFSFIDFGSVGDIFYSDLSKVMQINDIKMAAFIANMNLLCDLPESEKKISKENFEEYFFNALVVSDHFGPTEEQAGLLYDELCKLISVDNPETRDENTFAENDFFHSRLQEFLTDLQINQLVSQLRFRVTMRESNNNRRSLFKKSKNDQSNLFRSTRRRSSMVPVAPNLDQQSTITISRKLFVELYPIVLDGITSGQYADADKGKSSPNAAMITTKSIDIAFKNLSLDVSLAKKNIRILDNLTGRIKAGTMTALMGGSGAGKTSLLNALCGRAYYGEISGKISINGHTGHGIEDFKDSVGFVPQDDIMYSELTVVENLIFAGRFKLPASTTDDEIFNLAGRVMASLGLSRIANSRVGDVMRRGISGGEKKRVNIGIELMGNPKILFLDEPTSGLDASSAQLVMESLHDLVEHDNVTVTAAIHQPRKVIFELFDKVILLSVGGKMVFHGGINEAYTYFEAKGYILPAGENVADWLIDIASGLGTAVKLSSNPRSSRVGSMAQLHAARRRRSSLLSSTAGLIGVGAMDQIHPARDSLALLGSDAMDLTGSDDSSDDSSIEYPQLLHSSGHRTSLASPKSDAVHKEELENFERRSLNLSWIKYLPSLPDQSDYVPPPEYDLPKQRTRLSFTNQIITHMTRNTIVFYRNLWSRLIDTSIIVIATLLICLINGTLDLANWETSEVNFEYLLIDNDYRPTILSHRYLYRYVQSSVNALELFYLTCGCIVSLLIALQASKAIISKRVEFFREAGSGNDVNAYFIALNITTSVEYISQMMLVSAIVLWLRNSLTTYFVFFLNFALLAWTSASWSFFFAGFIPPANLSVTIGFFVAFCCLIFGGGLQPYDYEFIYTAPYYEVIAGIISPLRFFSESLIVSEYRCLPEQSGFTFDPNIATNITNAESSFMTLGFALRDSDTVIQRSCNGWFWGALPFFMVGLMLRVISCALMHVQDRGPQAKKPFLQELRRSDNVCKSYMKVGGVVCVVCGVVMVTVWSILRGDMEDRSFERS